MNIEQARQAIAAALDPVKDQKLNTHRIFADPVIDKPFGHLCWHGKTVGEALPFFEIKMAQSLVADWKVQRRYCGSEVQDVPKYCATYLVKYLERQAAAFERAHHDDGTGYEGEEEMVTRADIARQILKNRRANYLLGINEYWKYKVTEEKKPPPLPPKEEPKVKDRGRDRRKSCIPSFAPRPFTIKETPEALIFMPGRPPSEEADEECKIRFRIF